MKLIALKVGVLSCLAAGAVFAGPIDMSQIDAQAGWGIHIDVDRLKETQLGKHFLAELQKNDAQQKLAWFETFFGFDPVKSFHGVTLYGGITRPEDGVLLIRGDFDTNRLDQMPKNWGDYQGGLHGGHMVHSWVDQNKAGQPRTFAAIIGDTIVLSQKPGLVENTLDVIDGVRPSMKGNNPFKGKGVNDSKAFLVAAVSKAGRLNPKPVAAIIKQMTWVGLVASENEGQVQVELPLTAQNNESAQSFADIFRGLLGALKLQADNPDALALGNSIKITQNENTVIASMKMPMEDLLRMADQAKQKRLLR